MLNYVEREKKKELQQTSIRNYASSKKMKLYFLWCERQKKQKEKLKDQISILHAV